jgi:hypothetical protein
MILYVADIFDNKSNVALYIVINPKSYLKLETDKNLAVKTHGANKFSIFIESVTALQA